MPIYRYEHDCGYKHSQYLTQDKETVVLKCERCGRHVAARQVRDKTVVVKENNEVRGVLRHDNNFGGNGNANRV